MTEPFKVSSYANQFAKKTSFFFITLFTPGILIMSIVATSIDVLRCYFHNGLTDVVCLHTPYRYVLVSYFMNA